MVKIEIDKIIRSKRRTLALEISRDSSLIVRAPKKASLEYIEEIIQKKRRWIQRKQRIARDKYKSFAPKEFIDGEEFLYLGNTYRLSIIEKDDPPLILDREFQISKRCLADAREVFIDWYKKEAYKKFRERLTWRSDLAGLKFNKFNITNAKTRWGSCSSKGNLYFSWRLIMAPLFVLDYMIAHELAHIPEKNHSAGFWNKLKLIYPEYLEGQKWLKDHSHLIAAFP